jgi:hypothetical protein
MEKQQESRGLVPVERIERRILVVRGQNVMLDSDLADLYEVPTKALNQAVRRNRDRFPSDFMFQLEWEEARELLTRIIREDVVRPERIALESRSCRGGARRVGC